MRGRRSTKSRNHQREVTIVECTVTFIPRLRRPTPYPSKVLKFQVAVA